MVGIADPPQIAEPDIARRWKPEGTGEDRRHLGAGERIVGAETERIGAAFFQDPLVGQDFEVGSGPPYFVAQISEP